MKKIVIFGNQQISLDFAQWIQKQKNLNLIAFVGCQRTRDSDYGYPSTRIFCNTHNIPYFQPDRLDDIFFTQFTSWKPDICVSIYYRHIFSNKFLKIPPFGFINIHPSLLPKYRGAMPSLWALFNGERKVGTTLHYIDTGIDSGDIIAQREYALPGNITGYTLHLRLMRFGLQILKQYLPQILIGKVRSMAQDHSQASYYSSFDTKLRYIDWFSTCDRILARIKALTRPYDGAITTVSGVQVVFWNARPYKLSKRNLRQPGRIMKIFKDHTFVISCVDGFLLIIDFTVIKSTHKKSPISIGARFM